MRRMKCLLGILLLTFAVACGQSDKTFKEVVTFEKGFRFTSTGVIQTIPFTGGGTSMTYPPAGIPFSTGTAWGTSIANNSSNWNTSYSWGNHALAGYSKNNHTHSYSEITAKPDEMDISTALSELGIYLGKTTVELNAIVPLNGFGIAFDKTLNVYKVYSGSVWKTIITAN